jgi:cyclase
MLATRLIPSLLLKHDRLIKSIQFQEYRNIGNPINMVRIYNARDVDELVVLDIEAKTKGINYNLIEKMATELFIPFAVGGGIRTIDDVTHIIQHGADKIVINTIAITNPEFITQVAEMFGSQAVVTSIDVKDNKVYSTEYDPVEFAQKIELLGAGEIFLTSMEHDGMMNGYDLDLINRVAKSVNIPVICSGGAGKLQDFVDGINAGADAISAASIFHFTSTTPREVKQYMKNNGINMRI